MLFYNSGCDDAVTSVQHQNLPRRSGELRFIEPNANPAPLQADDSRHGAAMSQADVRREFAFQQRRALANHQVQLICRNFNARKQATRTEYDAIPLCIDCYYKKRLLLSANIQALALTDRVVDDTSMPPEHATFDIHEITRNLVGLLKKYRIVSTLDKILTFALIREILPANFRRESLYLILVHLS